VVVVPTRCVTMATTIVEIPSHVQHAATVVVAIHQEHTIDRNADNLGQGEKFIPNLCICVMFTTFVCMPVRWRWIVRQRYRQHLSARRVLHFYLAILNLVRSLGLWTPRKR
jgi:hypothetical protein